jgi:hypothetical protein
MTAKSMSYRTRLSASGQPLSRGRGSLTRLAIAAIFIGILVIELVAIGALLPAMVPHDAGASAHSTH